MRDFSRRETLLRLALLRAHQGNVRQLRRILARVPSVSTALAALARQPADVREWLSPLCAPAGAVPPPSSADAGFLALDDAAVIADDDDLFPPLLAEISEPPPLLFLRGDAGVLKRPQLAIVGSRHASPAGLATARAFAADLAAAGFVITSGLALGIDAMAHEGALSAGGATVAVLGCGADQVYPRRHAALSERIRLRGCLVSEFLPGTPPLAAHFPQRNRIISGMALGVLVVEAAPDSGSLITARFAAEQGREVFAIPGSIHSPMARGCHQLIREGATLIESSAQLMEALAHFVLPGHRAASATVRAINPVSVSAGAATLLRAMSPAGSAIDELVHQAGMDVAQAGALLNELVLQGMVHVLPGGRWQPARPIPGE